MKDISLELIVIMVLELVIFAVLIVIFIKRNEENNL